MHVAWTGRCARPCCRLCCTSLRAACGMSEIVVQDECHALLLVPMYVCGAMMSCPQEQACAASCGAGLAGMQVQCCWSNSASCIGGVHTGCCAIVAGMSMPDSVLAAWQSDCSVCCCRREGIVFCPGLLGQSVGSVRHGIVTTAHVPHVKKGSSGVPVYAGRVYRSCAPAVRAGAWMYSACHDGCGCLPRGHLVWVEDEVGSLWHHCLPQTCTRACT